MEIGDVLTGTVVNVQNFGLFVDVDGTLGLILIPELSWDRISHPSEIANLGDQIECKVIRLVPDAIQGQPEFTASVREVHPEFNPWRDSSVYEIGSVFRGTIVRIMSYGIFFSHPCGAWALLHNEDFDADQMSLGIGDSIDLVIAQVDVEQQKIRVTLK